MNRYLLVIVFLLSMHTASFADITFTSGKWETTFDCSDWVHPNSGSCDGLTLTGGGSSAGFINKTQITSDANYSSGSGGKGIRFWADTGDDVLSAPIYANLSSPETELWVRYYTRWESGFTWQNGNPGYEKSWYIRTYPSGDPSAIPGMAGNAWRITNQGGSQGVEYYPYADNYGWSYIYPGGTSDGSWYAVEFYIKMNTSTSADDGVGRMWIDGVLVGEELSAQWSGTNTSALQGWIQLMFRSNQAWPTVPREMYIDYDDIIIYNQTPPNTDAFGNAFIGLLSGETPGTGKAPYSPTARTGYSATSFATYSE